MRTLTLYLATLVSVLGIASASQANITFDLLWAGGGDSAQATISSTLVLELYASVTGSTEQLMGYQFALTWDAELDMIAGSLANTGPGIAGWNPGGAGEALATYPGPGGISAGISYSTLSAGAAIVAASGQVLIGSLQFHVNAAITDGIDVQAGYNTGPFGPTGDGPSGNNLGATTFNGASVNVIPEPTTASLLGLGLLGLTLAGRRRKS